MSDDKKKINHTKRKKNNDNYKNKDMIEKENSN